MHARDPLFERKPYRCSPGRNRKRPHGFPKSIAALYSEVSLEAG